MSRILLLHLDGSLPNLALMRIAAHHREIGDTVELRYAKNAEQLQRADLHISWEDWIAARGNPRNLGQRRVSLPLFPEDITHAIEVERR